MITLATLSKATAQEVFDQVATHLLEQNKACKSDEDTCLYRHESLKCAAGCLISDEEYDPSLEGNGWKTLAHNDIVSKCHSRLIIDLQYVHDAMYAETWKQGLVNVAEAYGLSTETLAAR
jgi:hypothetical protein